MDFKVQRRVLEEAKIFLQDRSTVREVAKKVSASKSTIHKDFVEKLPLINNDIYEEVSALLNYNKNIRHIRGGEATKKVFEKRQAKKPLVSEENNGQLSLWRKLKNTVQA